MAFEKQVFYEVEAYETYETDNIDELRKVANSRIDLPEGFQYDPDYLYLWIRIISSGEYYGPNKNGDYFPTLELETSYQTFNEANVFKNHENKHIEKAIGKIFLVRWDPVMKCVEIFKGIDKKNAAEIARGFLKGYMSDVSMGCKVPYTICSICGNKARKVTEFCRHIKNHRMEYLGNGERVFEINYEPKFHDSSVVLNGAERVAKALYIMDEPIEVGNTIVRSFRKSAAPLTLCESELEKMAQYNATELHPLLQVPTTEKIATDNIYMQKSAELEKEVTGKLLNIITSPTEYKTETSQQLIQIIKFLTEKRMDEDVLSAIAQNLSVIATREKIPVTKVFTAFLSVSEMLGIEFFPTELHTLLCALTSAKLEDSLKLSDAEKTEAYPTDFAKGVKFTHSLLERLPEFEDPSEILKTYDEVPFKMDEFSRDPFNFFNGMHSEEHELNTPAPMRVIQIVKKTLSPFQPLRSHHPEFLMPRLALVLGGHKSIIGDAEVAKDVQIMSSPQTIGDVLANLTYGNYVKMRPDIKHSILVKHAEQEERLFEKSAAEKPYKGIGWFSLAKGAIPAAYGASMFQKSREENGRNLTDVENFVKNRPDVIAGGTILLGKPLSRAIVNTTKKGKDLVVDGFKKLTSEEFVGLVKVADSLEHGNYNVFTKDTLGRFADKYQLDGEYAAAVKLASLYDIGGLEKEANELARRYEISDFEKAAFLREMQNELEMELEKAAGEFTNIMLMDAVATPKSLVTASLPGRVVDAMVFKQLSNLAKPKESTVPKAGESQ